MKKILNIAITLCALLLMSVSANAETTYDGIVYEVNYDYGDGTVVITGYEGTEFIINIPSEINGYKVKKIGDNAFLNSLAEHISLPETVTAIGNNAFSGCTDLMQINIPSGVREIGTYAFSGCTRLTEIYIPDGITTISEGTFSSCSDLNRVAIPYSVTTVGMNAFGECSMLFEVYYSGNHSMRDAIIFESGNEKLEQAFWSCDDTLEYIDSCGENAICKIYNDGRAMISGTGYIDNFSYAVSEIVINNGISGISEYAFSGSSLKEFDTHILYTNFCDMKNLTSVKLSCDYEIDFQAVFSDCTNLEDITIDTSYYKSVGGVVFSNDKKQLIFCPKAKGGAYTIPNGVTEILGNAFSGCYNFSEITFPESLKKIGASAFNGFNIQKIHIKDIEFWCGITFEDGASNPYGSLYINGEKVENITIPDGIEIINDYAFYMHKDLRGITFSDGLKSIGESAFCGCENLTEINLPESLETIGENAFSNCGFEEVYIPKNVSLIGELAFNIENLAEINVDAENKNYSSDNGALFDKNKTALIYFPKKKGAEYIIPDGVKTIKNYAFSGNSVLGKLTVPNSLKTVEPFSFYMCSKLNDVYYKGSETDWDSINIEGYNSKFENATRHYILFITYKTGGFAPIPEKIAVQSGDKVTLSDVAPQRLYYRFKGWSTKENDNAAKYQPGETIVMGKENLTLYAVWEKSAYTKTVKLEQINGIVFVVTPYGIEENADVIFACYEDNKLVKYETFKRGTNNMLVFMTDTDLEYDTVKILVWKNNSLIPLTEAENVK